MQAFTGLISVTELQAGMHQPDWKIVDCRFNLMDADQGRADFRAGHIPGAVYAHLDDDLAAPVTAGSGRHPLPTPQRFIETLERLGISTGDQVVAYDAAGGGIAARLWWMLRWLGHGRVAVLDGGITAWTAAGAAVDAGEVAPTPGHFQGKSMGQAQVIETGELAAALANGRLPLLVDAREADRFHGRVEPIDARAGHIPGAINFPFAQNTGEKGTWRSPTELAGLWRERLQGDPPADWVVMCGSGVTACHLALSALQAGLPPPRLYAGSWSEWIRDPARPVAP